MTSIAQRGSALPWWVIEWPPRLLVAALFLYTGVLKIAGAGEFVKEVQQYALVPVQWSNSVAYSLPWLEVLTAALLVIGLWRRESRLLLVAMLVVFTAAKAYGTATGRITHCGCVPRDSLLYFLFEGWMGVVTNVALLALLGVEAYAERCRRRFSAAAGGQSCHPVPD